MLELWTENVGWRKEIAEHFNDTECKLCVAGESAMKKPINLKPCPFCGSHATIIENSGRPKGAPHKFHAACNNEKCGAFTGLAWRSTAKETAEAWNTRAECKNAKE